MRRRKRDSAHGKPPVPSDFRFQPFRTLGRITAPAGIAPRDPQVETPPPVPTFESEEDLFAREMAGVRPLAPQQRARVPKSPAALAERQTTSPEAEVLAELSDLVAGHGDFDVTDTTEYVEGRAFGLDPRLVRQLRAGAFAYQNHIDLHGMRIEEARSTVDQFFRRSYQEGHRCVLIVHGRGLNSDGGFPVLKNWLIGWLSRGPGARMVLAFTSARACDGGAGALYVLLRRRRQRKQPIQVTEGSKV
jgi:DNA-nicking Smr family endonuclease